MTKAKLIKRDEFLEREQTQRARKVQQQAVKKTIDVVGEWIDRRRGERTNPRAAFAALFAQPQTQ
jgi:hypothetical protein